MADWAKILLKTGLIAGVMAGLWAVFTQIQFPAISFDGIFDGVGTAFAFINYWIPIFPILWNTALAMGSLLLALWVFRYATIAIRWLFKVNE